MLWRYLLEKKDVAPDIMASVSGTGGPAQQTMSTPTTI